MIELGKKERRAGKEWATKRKKLERAMNELEAVKKTIARLDRAVRWYDTRQGTKRCTADRESSSGSEGSPKCNGCPEMRSLTCDRGKGK